MTTVSVYNKTRCRLPLNMGENVLERGSHSCPVGFVCASALTMREPLPRVTPSKDKWITGYPGLKGVQVFTYICCWYASWVIQSAPCWACLPLWLDPVLNMSQGVWYKHILRCSAYEQTNVWHPSDELTIFFSFLGQMKQLLFMIFSFKKKKKKKLDPILTKCFQSLQTWKVD